MIFSSLLTKLLPLYAIILLGFISGKYLKAQRKTIASILIYILTPVVVFFGTLKAELTVGYLLLPVIFFVLCVIVALSFYLIGVLVYKQDNTKNILSFTAGTGNTGYFGLPVILMLFGDAGFSIAVLSALGFTLYENSIGFYITAKGNYSPRDSFKKVIGLPTLYAFIIGLLCNYYQIDFSETFFAVVNYFKGAYSVLGMMIIGMGLVGVSIKKIDYKLVGLTFAAKFIIRPIIVWGLIIMDTLYFGLFSEMTHKVITIMSLVPLAANTVAVATELDVQPEKAALVVVLSTLFALFYIPLMMSIL